jgi:FecR protein
MGQGKGRRRQAEDDLLDWFTITYRSIYIAVFALLAIGGAAFYFYYITHRPITIATPEPERPATTTARFTSVEGNVQVRTRGTFVWVNVDKNMLLHKSDLVRTSAGAAAEITFFDGTVVHVHPESLLTIEETSEDPSTKARRVAVNVPSGVASFQTSRKNVPESATEVSTPTVKSTVGEMSKAEVEVAETGDTSIRTFQGTVRGVTTGGQTVDLSSSEAVKVDAKGRASAKVTLPGAPTLVSPPHQTEITYPDPSRATTLLIWNPVLGATSYHLMLDYSAYFNRPLVDRKGITDNKQELRGLDLGKYYWHVAAIDKDGEEGPFSDFSRFTVARQAGGAVGDGPPPPLVIESLDVRTNILQIKGRTEPGATITVNNQRVDVDADGGFNDFITLEKVGKQIVIIRATGLNGGVNEARRPVVVAY